MKRKKVYVTSGDLAVCLIADGPLEACRNAVAAHGDGKTLDSEFFFVDERGHREGDDAQYKVPVEQALAEAGYVFDEPDDEGGGLLPLPPRDCPSAEE